MRRFIILLLLFIINTNILLCGGIFAPLDRSEWTMDYIIRTQPQDLVALVAVFPETVRPDGGGGNVQKLVLFDYYNPHNYKIVTDTTYRVTDPVFSHGKTKIIFGDTRRYIWDVGPSLVLYDIVQNTFEWLPHPGGSTLAGINVVWDVNDMGFYLSNEPAFGQSVYYYDLLSNTYTVIYHHYPMITYPVEILPPDTLIVFTNDTSVTHQPEGYYYMTTNGQFISRINNDKLIYYRKDAEYPLNLYPYVGKIKWYEDLQLFIFEERGDYYIPSRSIERRIALTNRNGTFHKFFPFSGYTDFLIGWNSHEKKIIVLRGSGGNKIMLLDYQTGEMRELLSPEIIPSCIAFDWAAF